MKWLLLFLFTSSALATTYYAGPSGTTNNTGLSSGSPWPLNYAALAVPPSNTVVVLSGIYTVTNQFYLTNSWVTFRADSKWGPKLLDATTTVFHPKSYVSGIVIDGLMFSNALSQPILFDGGSNHTVRNCWITKTASTYEGTQKSGSGITSQATINLMIERNLIEWNGSIPGYDHGIYASGTNVTIRNNVFRYNIAHGIQLDVAGCVLTNCHVYGNLIYSNCTGGGTITELTIYPEGGSNNFVYNNTIVGAGSYILNVQNNGECTFTNNIILSSGAGWYANGAVKADYNLAPRALLYSGPHDVISTNVNFLDAVNGLFWLRASSPARGVANPNIYGEVNFFGVAQSSVGDVGFFMFTPNLTNDNRHLDPSPINGADYWDESLLHSAYVGTLRIGP